MRDGIVIVGAAEGGWRWWGGGAACGLAATLYRLVSLTRLRSLV